MSIRSCRDCGYGCVYTADCSAAPYTGLQGSTEVPEQDLERVGGCPQRNITPEVDVEW